MRAKESRRPSSFVSRLLYCRLNNTVFTCYPPPLGFCSNLVIRLNSWGGGSHHHVGCPGSKCRGHRAGAGPGPRQLQGHPERLHRLRPSQVGPDTSLGALTSLLPGFLRGSCAGTAVPGLRCRPESAPRSRLELGCTGGRGLSGCHSSSKFQSGISLPGASSLGPTPAPPRARLNRGAWPQELSFTRKGPIRNPASWGQIPPRPRPELGCTRGGRGLRSYHSCAKSQSGIPLPGASLGPTPDSAFQKGNRVKELFFPPHLQLILQ